MDWIRLVEIVFLSGAFFGYVKSRFDTIAERLEELDNDVSELIKRCYSQHGIHIDGGEDEE